MNNQESLIPIDKDEYFKTFFEKRKALHMNLMQQLIAKSESKKELVMQQAHQIIDRFAEYRDDFIKNLPPQVKTMKVRDYMTKYDNNFQKCLKNVSMDEKNSSSILNEKFDIEPEFSVPIQKMPVETMITVPKFVIESEKSNSIPITKNDRTGFESLRSFDDKENDMFEPMSTEFIKDKSSKIKEDANGPKSSRKRKKPQIDHALRENKNLINVNPEHHKASFNPRIMNLIKEARMLEKSTPTVLGFTPTQNKTLPKFVSPAPGPIVDAGPITGINAGPYTGIGAGSSKKPWMP